MKKKILAGLAIGVMVLGMAGVANAATILMEDFENGVLDPRITVQTVGTFISTPGIKPFSSLDGQYSFGFGLSTNNFNSYDNYATNLIVTFEQPTPVSTISFIDMEVFDNWGSSGRVLADGLLIGDWNGFGRLPYNDRIADTTYRSHIFDIEKTVSQIVLRVDDITRRSEIYIDDITVSSATPTPLPGAVWLLGSSLAGLIGLHMKRK